MADAQIRNSTESGSRTGLGPILMPAAMVLAFYLVVTPVALLLRMLGRDPLQLRFDPATRSYWIRRDPDDGRSASMRSQF